jgi:hypothetical protein
LLITIAAGYFGGPVGAAVASAYTTAHSAAVNGTNLKDSYIAGARAGVMSGVSAGIFKGAHILGEAGGNTVARLMLHGVAGGVMSELNGGKFGHGFASAFVTQLLEGAITENVDALNKGLSWERVAVAGMVGGAVSAATGGRFVNGAVSGAMSRGLNAELDNENKESVKKAIGERLELEIKRGEIVKGVLKGEVVELGYNAESKKFEAKFKAAGSIDVSISVADYRFEKLNLDMKNVVGLEFGYKKGKLNWTVKGKPREIFGWKFESELASGSMPIDIKEWSGLAGEAVRAIESNYRETERVYDCIKNGCQEKY